MQNHCHYPPNKPNSRQNCHKNEPKPQKGVNFFINDVEGHHTESIVFLNLSGRTKLVKSALGYLEKEKKDNCAANIPRITHLIRMINEERNRP